jgi:hypothetical protein
MRPGADKDMRAIGQLTALNWGRLIASEYTDKASALIEKSKGMRNFSQGTRNEENRSSKSCLSSTIALHTDIPSYAIKSPVLEMSPKLQIAENEGTAITNIPTNALSQIAERGDVETEGSEADATTNSTISSETLRRHMYREEIDQEREDIGRTEFESPRLERSDSFIEIE